MQKPFSSRRKMLRKETYIDTQFEIDTIKAVPTPLLDVGEKVLAAQLLYIPSVDSRNCTEKAHMTRGNK